MPISKHTVSIYDRGGIHPLGVLQSRDVSSVRWERVRDDVSEGSVALTGDAGCGPLLGNLAAFRHELVVHRDGNRVWEGPITHLNYTGNRVTISARDVLQWAGRTTIKQTLANAYPNVISVVERARILLTREMALHESPRFSSVPPLNFLRGLKPIYDDADAQNSSTTLAYEKYVWEELDDLAQNGGLDYTVVGRSTIIHDTHTDIGTGRRLTDADFEDDISVTIYGMDLATISAVTDRRGRFGGVGNEDQFYGSVEILHGTYNEDDDPDDPDFQEVSIEEMREQAIRNLSSRYPVPMVVRVPENASISSRTFDELLPWMIPGVRFPLRSTSTLRHVEQMQKLDKVAVQETASGERVSISLTPAPRIYAKEADPPVTYPDGVTP